METACFSGTLALTYETTWCQNRRHPQEGILTSNQTFKAKPMLLAGMILVMNTNGMLIPDAETIWTKMTGSPLG
jgi:hypothetical protein